MCHTPDCSAGCYIYAKLSLLWSLLIVLFKSLVKLCGGRNNLSKGKKGSGRNKGFHSFLCGALVFDHNFLGREHSTAGSSAKNCEFHLFLDLNMKISVCKHWDFQICSLAGPPRNIFVSVTAVLPLLMEELQQQDDFYSARWNYMGKNPCSFFKKCSDAYPWPYLYPDSFA